MVCPGHPLHSTALEEDLQPPQAEDPRKSKEPTPRQRGAKRKQEPDEEEEKENAEKRSVKVK